MSLSSSHEKKEARIKQFGSGKLNIEHQKQASKSERAALVAEFNEIKAARDDKWESMPEAIEMAWADLTSPSEKKTTEAPA